MWDLSNIILHFFITHMIPYAKPNTRQSLLAQMVICKGYKIETQFVWRILMEFDSDYSSVYTDMKQKWLRHLFLR